MSCAFPVVYGSWEKCAFIRIHHGLWEPALWVSCVLVWSHCWQCVRGCSGSVHGELKWFNTSSNINEHYSLINRKKSMLPVLGNVAAKIIICQSTIYIYIRGGTIRLPNRTVHGVHSKWKWSSLSPWSEDFGVNRADTVFNTDNCKKYFLEHQISILEWFLKDQFTD